jgi:hypothetical protein
LSPERECITGGSKKQLGSRVEAIALPDLQGARLVLCLG